MTKKKFNPADWLSNTQTTANSKNPSSPNVTIEDQSIVQEVERIVSRIEAKSIDIAAAYADWRDIGFAFSNALGEQGRDYFHRVSRFYPDYSTTECNRQYDNCLKSNGSGITPKTFFFRAKNAGVDISSQTSIVTDNEQLPTFPGVVYDYLPQFLKQICQVAQTPDERDILLLGAIATLSSCVPNIYGIYHNRKVYANLFLFVTAKASAGKGLLTHCTRLVYPVHKQLREECQLQKADYEREMNEYLILRKKNPSAERPQKPPEKMLFIPANNSASGVFQLMHDNNGKGLIFETEGDTLAYTFKTDYGNYSDGFRKAFHHETIRYYRKTDREFVDIESPCLSAVLSGTPKQVQNLIPDAENGLFSRFIFYYLAMSSEWKDVFARSADNGLDGHFDGLALQYLELFKTLNTSFEIEFLFTMGQQNTFNETFSLWHHKFETLMGQDYNATVRRLGLITFRMAMIFTALRIMETGDISPKLICEERDFQNAITMTGILLEHSKKVFSELPQPILQPKRENREERFYSILPNEFSRKHYVEVAQQLNIPDKTAQNYIAKLLKTGLIHRDKQDFYLKMSTKDVKDLAET
jgi:hypothetical protein